LFQDDPVKAPGMLARVLRRLLPLRLKPQPEVNHYLKK
jgi:hypothetical protein